MRWKVRGIAVAAVSAALAAGCASEPKETEAQRQARIAEARRVLKERQDRLGVRAEQRLAAGEVAPPRVEDPGYPIAICGPAGSDADLANSGFLNGEDWYLCQHGKRSRQIIEYRKWYCRGEELICVTGSWEDGKPLFGARGMRLHMVPGGTVINMSGNVVRLAPPDIPWP